MQKLNKIFGKKFHRAGKKFLNATKKINFVTNVKIYNNLFSMLYEKELEQPVC